MINRLFKIVTAEVNSLLDDWERNLKFRKEEKTYTESYSSTEKKQYKSEYTKKERQAFFDLELHPTKDKELIKKQFKSQVKKYHPDKYQDEEKKKNAEIITKRLIAAYELLYKK